MARRRMISNEITGSYNFQSMEPKTQLLYFYCCLSADDDGFVGNPYIYTILTGCSENDLETLEQRGFVIRFASGVLAVVHWYIHNTIKKDRYNPTVHKAEHAQLRLEDKCYVRAPQPETERNQNGTKMEPQYSQVKSSQVKSSQVKSSQAESRQIESRQGESKQGESSQGESKQGDWIPKKNNRDTDRTVKRSLFPLFSYDHLFSVKEIFVSYPSEEVQRTEKPHAKKHTAWICAPCKELISLQKQRPKNKGEPCSPLLAV